MVDKRISAVWKDFSKEQPEKPDSLSFDEYIVMIAGEEKPTSLLWTGSSWIDYNFETFNVVAWAHMPAPPSDFQSGRMSHN